MKILLILKYMKKMQFKIKIDKDTNDIDDTYSKFIFIL
jgi:hypothetical protein